MRGQRPAPGGLQPAATSFERGCQPGCNAVAGVFEMASSVVSLKSAEEKPHRSPPCVVAALVDILDIDCGPRLA